EQWTSGILVNPSLAPRTVVFEVRSDSCHRYDLFVALNASSCLEAPFELLSPVQGVYSSRNGLLAGTYSGFEANGDLRFRVSLAPGQTATVRAFHTGTPDLRVRWCDPATYYGYGCFENGTANTTVGNPAIVAVQNPSPWEESEFQFDVAPATSFGAHPCDRIRIELDGVGGAFGSPLQQSFCDPGHNHSLGWSAELVAWQPLGIYEPEVQFECRHGVPGMFGYLVVATGLQLPGVALSQGELCLSGAGGFLGRYNVPGELQSLGQFDVDGLWRSAVGNSTTASGYLVPDQTPWGATVTAGLALHFQLWYRDFGGMSNLSNGISLTF
ncbi:MAG: hypothetical protein R3E96_17430, partial [Planctomycetota bacterium]